MTEKRKAGKRKIIIAGDSDMLAAELASAFIEDIRNILSERGKAFIALSGGSTPLRFYRKVAAHPEAGKIDWSAVTFFWSDERCVPPGHPDSNYGLAERELFRVLRIPADRIFRVMGEKDPAEAAKVYNDLLMNKVPLYREIPCFDRIFLGMGEDGHTASVFPYQAELWDSEENCIVASHPLTAQKRVSFSGRVINNAKVVSIVVTGSAKQKIIEEVLKEDPGYLKYPVSRVDPVHGTLEWWLDREAAGTIISIRTE